MSKYGPGRWLGVLVFGAVLAVALYTADELSTHAQRNSSATLAHSSTAGVSTHSSRPTAPVTPRGYTLTQHDLDTLLPHWHLRKLTTIGNSRLTVFGATNAAGSEVEIAIARLSSQSKWSLTWKSYPIGTLLPSFLATGGLPVESLTVDMPADSPVALVAANINTGAPHTSNDVRRTGECDVVNHASLQGPMTVDSNDSGIIVEGQGAPPSLITR